MRVLITGGQGFVGRHLAEELTAAGHEAVAPGSAELDVTDLAAVSASLAATRPAAVAHLAAVSFAPDANADPERALRVAVAGTANLFEAVRSSSLAPCTLVVSSSEVYGAPQPGDLPLGEAAPLRPRTPYASAKVAQESVALAYAARFGLRVAVARSFNHSGPGQRPVSVVPAMAQRVRELAAGRTAAIRVGNLEVRRDFTHVRDVVAAYRLLLEAMATEDGNSGLGAGGVVFNVASGRSILVRSIVETFCRLAGVPCVIEVDPALVRADDPPDIVGDASALRRAVGWAPRLTVDTMLEDVWDATASG